MRVDRLYKIFQWQACDAGSNASWCTKGSKWGVYLNHNGEVQDHPRSREGKNKGYSQFEWL